MAITKVFQRENQVVCIRDGRYIRFIPIRQFTFEILEEHVELQGKGRDIKILFTELVDGDDNAVGGKEDAINYLSPFVGFNSGGGGENVPPPFLEGSVSTFPDLPQPPSDYTGKRYEVLLGSGGTNIPLVGRVGGKDAGVYRSNGVDWVKLSQKELDATDIILDGSVLSFTNSNVLKEVLDDVDTAIQDQNDKNTGSVSVHNDMDTSNAQSNPKEVLVNNGSNVFGARTLELDDLDDVNTQNVVPENNWILKYRNGVVVPAMKKVLENSSLSVATTNTQLEVQIDEQVNFQRAGRYSFDVRFSHSYDVTTTDLVAFLSVDGDFVTDIAQGEILRLEPKDSGGNDFDGRGTNQKDMFSQKYFVDISDVGNKRVVLYFFPSSDFTEGSMWDASITIEEEF